MYANTRTNVNQLEALRLCFMLCTVVKECIEETSQIYKYVVKSSTIKYQDMKCLH